MEKIKAFFKKPIFSDYRVLFGLWIILAVVAHLLKYWHERHNNYLIFKYVYWHTIKGTSLYALSPTEFKDCNHYGPFFSMIIGPFAVLPDFIGMLLWLVVLTTMLYYAIRKLPTTKRVQIFILWFAAHELLTALFMQQFNIATAAMIIATFTCVEKERDGWAAFWVVVGMFVKLYGVVGLIFFVFSRHKGKFLAYLLLWSAIVFAAPMLISSFDYQVSQYPEWLHALVVKNVSNSNLVGLTNISLFGMVHRLTGDAGFSNLYLIIPGLILLVLPFMRVSQYKNADFRMAFLASVMLFVILFSTGSESSTYIVAIVGVVLWYAAVPWKRGKWCIALMVFVFLLTCMSGSDIVPKFIRKQYVQAYSLKALPCIIVWLRLIYEMCVKDYTALNKKIE